MFVSHKPKNKFWSSISFPLLKFYRLRLIRRDLYRSYKNVIPRETPHTNEHRPVGE